MSEWSAPEKSGVQSLDRAFAMLMYIARKAPEGVRLSDLATACDLNRSTTHRLLKSLAALGLVEQEARSSRYFVGVMALELSGGAERRFDIVQRSAAARVAIAREVGDTVFLTERRGNEMICTARSAGSYPVKVLTLDVNARRPLGVGAGGLAILAAIDRPERDRIIAECAAEYRSFGLDSRDVGRLAEEARVRGHAVDRGRVLDGVTGVGLVLKGTSGASLASLSVAATSNRMTDARIDWIAERLRAQAQLTQTQQKVGEPHEP